MGRKRLYSPDVAYQRIIDRTTKYLQDNQDYRLFQSTKARAKKLKIEFNLELSDFIIPDVCPYLGIKITNIMGCGRQPSNASIDRIDSSKGYIKGNIQIISDLANRMKQDASKDELITFAKNILKIHLDK